MPCHYVKFYKSNYNYLHEVVQQALSYRSGHTSDYVKVICKKCHMCLCKSLPTMPKNAVAFKHNLHSVQCVCCSKDVEKKSAISFDVNNYNHDSSIVKCISHGMQSTDSNSHHICRKCNNYLKNQSLVLCCMCHKQMKWYLAILFNEQNYDHPLVLTTSLHTYIFKNCHTNLLPVSCCMCQKQVK